MPHTHEYPILTSKKSPYFKSAINFLKNYNAKNADVSLDKTLQHYFELALEAATLHQGTDGMMQVSNMICFYRRETIVRILINDNRTTFGTEIIDKLKKPLTVIDKELNLNNIKTLLSNFIKYDKVDANTLHNFLNLNIDILQLSDQDINKYFKELDRLFKFLQTTILNSITCSYEPYFYIKTTDLEFKNFELKTGANWWQKLLKMTFKPFFKQNESYKNFFQELQSYKNLGKSLLTIKNDFDKKKQALEKNKPHKKIIDFYTKQSELHGNLQKAVIDYTNHLEYQFKEHVKQNRMLNNKDISFQAKFIDNLTHPQPTKGFKNIIVTIDKETPKYFMPFLLLQGVCKNLSINESDQSKLDINILNLPKLPTDIIVEIFSYIKDYDIALPKFDLIVVGNDNETTQGNI
jgi:hypothetical protein